MRAYGFFMYPGLNGIASLCRIRHIHPTSPRVTRNKPKETVMTENKTTYESSTMNKSGATNYTPNTNKQASHPANAAGDSNAKLHAEIKKTWNKLSDDEIKLYETQPDQFFDKVKTKQGVNRDDADKKMATMKTSCGCGTEKAA
jgi:hypothetical protein